MDAHSSPYTIHLVGHAHIDLAYRWRWNETVHRIARDTFRGVLRMMDEQPELIFVQSQLALYEAMEEHYPALFTQIQRRVAEGRWIVADGWCEYDHTMPGGEAIIRQHLIAQRYARERLGCRITLAWAPDAFSGHMATLPTILRGCGIDCLLFGRGMPPGTPAFWWQGPDGARVLAYTPSGTYNAQVGPELAAQMPAWEQMTGLRDRLVLYGRGDHGGGPREEDFAALAELRAQPAGPRIVHTAPERFFREVLAPRAGLPVHVGELGGGFTGSCSSEGRNKQRNRRLESLILTAERFATIATYCQRKPVYPRVDMTESWKLLLRHQFHDELPGTSRGPVYSDNARDYDRLEAELQEILDTALAEIGARLDTRGPGTPIVVYNPLAWTRSEPAPVSLRLNAPPQQLVVRDPAGRALPTQVLSVAPEGPFWRASVLFLARDVPPLGYRLFRAYDEAQPAEADEAVTLRGNVLENARLRVTLDPRTGHITSVYDKSQEREALGGPANVLQAIAERPGAHSAWIIALTDAVDTLATPEAVEAVEHGPVRATFRVRYRYRDSYFTQEISLCAGRPWVDLRLQAEWHERDCCLKVAFSSAAPGEAAFEAPFGHVVRPADGAEVLAQNWIDLSAPACGLSLLNDCRYGFDIRGHVLRMTLLRGAPDLDPRADEGHHDLRYALYPHAGGWREGHTVRRALDLNMPLLARQELQRAGMLRPWTNYAVYRALPAEFAFLQVGPENVVLTALKVEEEDWGHWSPLVVRLYETAGRPCEAVLRLPAPMRFCEETNHLEERIESDAYTWEGDTLRIRFRPYEIRTFRLALAIRSLAQDPSEQGDEGYVGDPPVFD